jgi:hypothetical protein
MYGFDKYIYMQESKCTKIKFEVAIVSTSIHIEFYKEIEDELVMITEFDCAKIEEIIMEGKIIDLGGKKPQKVVYEYGKFKAENCYMIEKVGQLEKGRVAVIVEPVHKAS